MKKYLIPLLMLLCGCTKASTEVSTEATTEAPQQSDSQYRYDIYEVAYKGHDYIVFGYKTTVGSGVVHNPDCRKCKTDSI